MSDPTAPATAADLATLPEALPLRGLQLIGIAGTQDAPRALLRSPNGKIETVGIGDTVRRRTVVAIDADAILLSSSHGTETLHMPDLPQERDAA